MKMNTHKNNYKFLNAYNILIMSIIACTITSLIIVWLWYGHRDAQIENQLLQIK
jgi:hypothetical protein